MAAPLGGGLGDGRRGVSSPRPKGRGKDNAKNTLCRNVTIYGHCRYEKDGCLYNHPPPQNENVKKRFNVDSPSFTPLQPAVNGALGGPKSTTISPKAANAKIFTPQSTKSSTSAQSHPSRDSAPEWNAQEFQDFVPQNFEAGQYNDPNASSGVMNQFDQYVMTSAMPGLTGANQQAQLNPYVTDAASLGNSAAFFQGGGGFQAPPQYHLYVPMGPHKENLLAYQRTAHDFFIADELREELQKKSDAAHQILPNTTLPQVDHFHSLVPIDKGPQKTQPHLGYPNWIYKAVNSKDGNLYALRRLEGYRLTDEKAIRSVQAWKRINNGSVVTIHDAFTTRIFGDSSLIFVTDYHPNSKTLAEHHFSYQPRYHGGRASAPHVPEQVLWGYIVQIAQALKAIHSTGLAARLITPSRVLITSKNRVRLNGCAILDVTKFDTPGSLAEYQSNDLVQLGELILSIATNSQQGITNPIKAIEQLSRGYSERLKEAVAWLLTPPPPSPATTPQSPTGSTIASVKDIDGFLLGLTSQFATVLDSTLHAEDTLMSTLNRELENARLVRLMTKLGFVNERPGYDSTGASQEHSGRGTGHHAGGPGLPGGPGHHHGHHLGGGAHPYNRQQSLPTAWSETGERYYLKLFRDYVFHQVDGNGNPVVDLSHVISCLNKLDAGSDERIQLATRDEQSILVVSYKELKRAMDTSFMDLVKWNRR